MNKTIEFYYDFGSPTTYLAYTQLPALAARHGAVIDWKPVLLGGIFKATGNASPVMIPAKGSYMFADLQRFAQRYGVPLTFNPNFPINTLSLMRGAYVALEEGTHDAYAAMAFSGMWEKALNLNDPEVTAKLFSDYGFDAAHYQTRSQEPAIKKALMDATAAAVERGLFGAPTFFVGDEMFFGQDRLDFIEEALSA